MTSETKVLKLSFRLEHEAAESLSEALLSDGALGLESFDKTEFTALSKKANTPDYQAEDYLAELDDTVVLSGFFYGERQNETSYIDVFQIPRFDYALYDDAPRERVPLLAFLEQTLNEQVKRIEKYLETTITFEGADFVEPLDWAERWKAYFKPFLSGQRLYVSPSWLHEPTPPGRVRLIMDPGAAFGSGTHETTALCLLLLEETLEGMPQAASMEALDLGCGSGILGIALALLTGVKPELLDLDPFAVEQAAENVKINGLTLDLRQGELKDSLLPAYDLIVANLITRVHSSLKTAYKKKLKPGGRILVSGILNADAKGLLEEFEAVGLTVEKQRSGKEWSAFLLCHKN